MPSGADLFCPACCIPATDGSGVKEFFKILFFGCLSKKSFGNGVADTTGFVLAFSSAFLRFSSSIKASVAADTLYFFVLEFDSGLSFSLAIIWRNFTWSTTDLFDAILKRFR